MKKIFIFSAAMLLGTSLWATGATFARIKTWSNGQVLTASDLNAEFNNILNNFTPAGMDDYSADLTAMRSQADPYPGSVESQATSLQGEIERLRYQILQLKSAIQTTNVTYWYQRAPTAGVFTIAGSSVGVNNTNPTTYNLDVVGLGRITGAVFLGGPTTFSSGLTATGASLSIATHTAITGDLSVSGALTISGISHVIAYSTFSTSGTPFAAVTNTRITQMQTETADSLGEWNGTTFTAITAGFYYASACAYTSDPDGVGNGGYLHVVKNAAVNTAGSDYDAAFPDVPAASDVCAGGLFSLAAGNTITFWLRPADDVNLLLGCMATIYRVP